MELTANRLDFATEGEAIEHYMEVGWTDGLPVVPPTPERVTAMLEAGGLEPGEILGEVPTRNVVVTAEAAAVNAVMAGCAVEYFPVVVAALRAHFQVEGNSHSTTATLAGAAQVIVVNGPVRNELDIASGQACFGPGFRANATIGRALRLVIRNVCRSIPGVLDRASFSWPLRYSFCFGENEEASDWRPLHVQRGFEPDDSVATVVSLMNLLRANEFAPEPEAILNAVATVARHVGVGHDEFLGDGRSILVVMGPEHQRRLVDAGWSKEKAQEYLWPLLTAESRDRYDRRLDLARPENILIVAAGGPGMADSWLFLPHLSNPVSEKVVRP
ncbi:MAG TPA: hypothetical protein VIL48_23845 [Acidimicrobiales bacterium]